MTASRNGIGVVAKAVEICGQPPKARFRRCDDAMHGPHPRNLGVPFFHRKSFVRQDSTAQSRRQDSAVSSHCVHTCSRVKEKRNGRRSGGKYLGSKAHRPLADRLQARLQGHAKAFEGLMSLLPPDLYYGKQNTGVCRMIRTI